MTAPPTISPLEHALLAAAAQELAQWESTDVSVIHEQPTPRERARVREAIADANYDTVKLSVRGWLGAEYCNDRGRHRVSRALGKLESLGLVERLRMGTTRTTHLRITPAGKAASKQTNNNTAKAGEKELSSHGR
ncbi:MAG: hypothetical protein AAFV43_17240 [Planctomycetota bacterium]